MSFLRPWQLLQPHEARLATFRMFDATKAALARCTARGTCRSRSKEISATIQTTVPAGHPEAFKSNLYLRHQFQFVAA